MICFLHEDQPCVNTIRCTSPCKSTHASSKQASKNAGKTICIGIGWSLICALLLLQRKYPIAICRLGDDFPLED